MDMNRAGYKLQLIMLLGCLCWRRSSSNDLPDFEIINRPRISRPRLRRMEPYVQSMSVISESAPAQNPRFIPTDCSSSPDTTLVRPTSAWARFPSHTRAERCCSPAGREDNVYSHDFAADFPVTKTESDMERGRFSFLKGGKEAQNQKRKGPRKMVVDVVSRCYTIGFRGIERGHRSSLSAGGLLEYPELELLPSIGLLPPSHHIPQPTSENVESSRFDRAASIFCRAASPFKDAVSSLNHAASLRSLVARHSNRDMPPSDSISDNSASTTIIKSARPRIAKSSSHLNCPVAKPAVASVSRASL